MPKRKRKSNAEVLQRQRAYNTTRRQDPDFREQEQVLDSVARNSKREDPTVRNAEQVSDTTAHTSKRSDPTVRVAEQARNTRARIARRDDPDFREQEQVLDSVARNSKREDPKVRKAEQVSDTTAHTSKRSDPTVRVAEQARNTRARIARRDDPDFREQEQVLDSVARNSKREDPKVRKAEQVSDTTAHTSKRSDPTVRVAEQARNTRARIARRDDPDFREQEQVLDSVARNSKREDPKVRKAEQVSDTAAHTSKRSDPTVRVAEQARNTRARIARRDDPDFREQEQVLDSVARNSKREDPKVRKAEQVSDTAAHTSKRSDPTVRVEEQARNTSARVARRNDPNFGELRRSERIRDATSRQLLRADPNVRHQERLKEAQSRKTLRSKLNSDYNKLMQKYLQRIKEAPTYICSSCGGLWYLESTKMITEEQLVAKNFTPEEIAQILYVSQEIHRLCSTCKNAVNRNTIPRMCLANGFDFPEQHETLEDLSPLEERLVSLRIPFMQIRLVGSERQSKLKGNIVNVENDLEIVAQTLPLEFNETSTVQVKLMRKMDYTVPYMYETIRPEKVYNAAKYLITTPLYEGTILSESWERDHPFNTEQFICGNNENSEQNLPPDIEHSDLNEEYEPMADETLIFSEQEALDQLCIKIAPGEGKTPISLFADKDAELLSFPKIYGGQKRQYKEGIKATITDIAKSELRRYDRRACQPTKLLYSFKKSFNEKVIQAIQVCLRKSTGQKITAKNALDKNFIQGLISKDYGYSTFKHLRSSPSYWKEKTKTVLAMVRQIGKPTFFITLSAAETKWTELLISLYKILKDEDITEEEVKNLTFEEVSSLIRNDPVTCMRHFDHRYRALLNLLLKPEGGIFGPYKLKEYFSRLEFQMRGSPHSHGLYWIEDAPEYIEGDEESIAKCTTFIDEFITTKRDEDPEMDSLIGYQLHKHSGTCKNKDGIPCRFGYPLPPMDETRILTPLPDGTSTTEKQKATSNFKKLKDHLDTLGRHFKEDIPFDDFLTKVDMNKLEYIQAIRSSLNRATVLLKRSTNAIFINAYNEKLLKAWGANIDFQFILDTYACAKYCVGYILKAETGMSKLLQKLASEIQHGNVTAKEQMKKFGSVLINGSEISTQEAAAFLLGIPNTMCSRSDTFINTNPPENRVSILKTKKELENLGEEEDDVFQKGVIDRYTHRPVEIESCSLAEFASWYEFSKRRSSFPSQNLQVDDDPTPRRSQTIRGSISLELLDDNGYIKRRKTNKVIRYRNYGRAQDPSNYYREQIMLFYPWRNEHSELLDINSEEVYNANLETILDNSKDYIHNRNVTQNILDELVRNITQTLTPNEDEEPLLDEDLETLEEDLAATTFEDEILNQQPASSKFEKFLPPKMIDNESYFKIMRSLNQIQRKFVFDIVHLFKNLKTFYKFLSGGAGVGKSYVITAIVQTLLRYQQTIPSENPGQFCVIVCAPTGKAAFNVFGSTMHSAFKLPRTTHHTKLAPLEPSALNTMRTRLAKVELFIIDEVSMVGVDQPYQIDQRLRQIYGNNRDFGGKSVIFVGHLRQLAPIKSRYVFETPVHPLGVITGNYLWDHFSMLQLTEIMRQVGDYNFCKALNNMSETEMDDDDIALIKECELPDDDEGPLNAIHLFRKNIDCQAFNKKIHQRLGTEGFLSTAYDRIQGKGTLEEKEQLREYSSKLRPQETEGLPSELQLQIGAEYFVSTNIDVEDGLFNGSTGQLKHIQYGFTKTRRKLAVCAYFDFRNNMVGSRQRSRFKNQFNRFKHIDHTWTPIFKVKRQINIRKRIRKFLQVIREQFPLIAANAMTIAKAQGTSLDCVVVWLTELLTPEEIYVACSRARTRKGLFFKGKFTPPAKRAPNHPVTVEIKRLVEKGYEFSLKFLQDLPPTFNKLYYHNIQSFLLHFEDLKSDDCPMCSDVIALVEPHLLQSDNFNLPNFSTAHRVNCSTTRNSEGCLILQSNTSPESVAGFSHRILTSGSGHCILTTWKTGEVRIILVYKSPSYNNNFFLQKLTTFLTPFLSDLIILIGDFNIDIRTQENSLVNKMLALGLICKTDSSGSTTNFQTHIDCCFSNCPMVHVNIYESYYSYHKPLCVFWER